MKQQKHTALSSSKMIIRQTIGTFAFSATNIPGQICLRIRAAQQVVRTPEQGSWRTKSIQLIRVSLEDAIPVPNDRTLTGTDGNTGHLKDRGR